MVIRLGHNSAGNQMKVIDGEDDIDAIDFVAKADLNGLDLLFTEDPAGINDESIA